MMRKTVIIPEEIWQDITSIAEQEGKTAVEVIRTMIKLGLLAKTGEVELYTKNGKKVLLID